MGSFLFAEQDDHAKTHDSRHDQDPRTCKKAFQTTPVYPFSFTIIPNSAAVEKKNQQGNQGTSAKEQEIQQSISHFRPGSRQTGQKICQHQVIEHMQQNCPDNGVFHCHISQQQSHQHRIGRLQQVTVKKAKQQRRTQNRKAVYQKKRESIIYRTHLHGMYGKRTGGKFFREQWS